MTKKTKQVSISVDKEVWDAFVKRVESVEGKTYGKIGPTLTNLVNDYYLSDDGESVNVKKINKLQDELDSLKDEYDDLLKENKSLLDENSNYSSQTASLNKDVEKLSNQNEKLSDTYHSLLEDNQKNMELLDKLDEKVSKLSNENQHLIECVTIKSNENKQMYINATKNEEKLKKLNSKYKNKIKKLLNKNKILHKQVRHLKHDKKHTKRKINVNSTENYQDTQLIQNKQLKNQYDEYMKQFENIKRK